MLPSSLHVVSTQYLRCFQPIFYPPSAMFSTQYQIIAFVISLGQLITITFGISEENSVYKLNKQVDRIHEAVDHLRNSKTEVIDDDDEPEDSNTPSNDDTDYGFKAWNYFGITSGSLALLWILFWGCTLFYIYVGCRCFRRRKFTTLSSQSARSSEFHHSNYITFSGVSNPNIETGARPPPYDAISRDEPYEGGFTGIPITAAVRRQQNMLLPTYTEAIFDFNLETNV